MNVPSRPAFGVAPVAIDALAVPPARSALANTDVQHLLGLKGEADFIAQVNHTALQEPNESVVPVITQKVDAQSRAGSKARQGGIAAANLNSFSVELGGESPPNFRTAAQNRRNPNKE